MMASAAAVWTLVGAAPPARAADSAWTSGTGGDFSVGTNWSTTPNPPGAADVAIFNNNLTGAVSFTGPVTNTSLALRANTGGTVTLDLNGFTYTVSSATGFTPINFGTTAATASNNTKLVITDGSVVAPGNSFSIGQGGGIGNELELSGGATMTGTNTGTLAGFVIGGSAGAASNTLRITGTGSTYTIAATGNSLLGATNATTTTGASTNNNSIVISNGGTLNSAGSVHVGSYNATASTHNVLLVDGGTYLNNTASVTRGIVIRDGALRIINNGYVQPGMLNMIENPAETSLDFQSGILQVERWRVGQNSTITIGDGTGASATYRTTSTASFMGVTDIPTPGVPGNILQPTSAFNLVLNTDGHIVARGTIAGSVSALGPGPTATMDTNAPENLESLTVNGNWDSTNIALTFKLGDFPTELAEDLAVPQTFVPPRDFLDVNGLFTHGSSVTIDLQHYVAPADQDYVVQLLKWDTVAGTAPTVNFINGAPLAYSWGSDGLYVTAAVPEPATTMSLAALAACGLLVRRRGEHR